MFLKVDFKSAGSISVPALTAIYFNYP